MDEKEILRGYRTAMSAMILRAKGGKGFIFTPKANRLAKEMKPMLKQADKYSNAGESMLAFGLFSLIMEKLIIAIHQGDDSSGTVGELLTESGDKLIEITRSLTKRSKTGDQEAMRSLHDIRKQTLKIIDKKSFGSWDWNLCWVEIAGLCVTTDKEFDAFMELADACLHDPDYASYWTEEIIYRTIDGYKGDEASYKYLIEHMATNPRLDRVYVERLMMIGEMDEALDYCLASLEIEQDSRDREGPHLSQYNPSWLIPWEEFIVTIAEMTGDRQLQYETALDLFLNWSGTDQLYWPVVKSTYPGTNWTHELDRILSVCKSHKKRKSKFFFICHREGLQSHLIQHFRETDAQLYEISTYEQFLKEEYRNELIMLYIEQIQKFMQWAVGRRYYQAAAGYVKRIRKLGGEEAAIILVDTLCSRYPARTAMIEELRRALG